MSQITPSANPDNLVSIPGIASIIRMIGGLAVFKDVRAEMAAPMLRIASSTKYVEVGRAVCVLDGSAEFVVNTVPHTLISGDVFVIPEKGYIEIHKVSENFKIHGCSFRNPSVPIVSCIHLHPSETDIDRIKLYYLLLWELADGRPEHQELAASVQDLLIHDIFILKSEQKESATSPRKTAGEYHFSRFLEIVSGNSAIPHTVAEYASLLSVTPNHLSALVRRYSGKTVMEWVDERIVLDAKVLLKSTDAPIYEIADRLKFKSETFFCRYFKRETGMSPRQYRIASHEIGPTPK